MISSPKNVLCGSSQQFLGDSLLPLNSRNGRFSGLRIDVGFPLGRGGCGGVSAAAERWLSVLLTGERQERPCSLPPIPLQPARGRSPQRLPAQSCHPRAVAQGPVLSLSHSGPPGSQVFPPREHPPPVLRQPSQLGAEAGGREVFGSRPPSRP